jgi:hypothetical protein
MGGTVSDHRLIFGTQRGALATTEGKFALPLPAASTACAAGDRWAGKKPQCVKVYRQIGGIYPAHREQDRIEALSNAH